jgi:RNA polymerase sigma factor (sigma-70 family)
MTDDPEDDSLHADSTTVVRDRAPRGETAVIQALIARAVPSVRRWARGRVPPYVRHEANTDDVLQEAVLRTLKTLTRVRHRTVGGLQAYLRSGVINRIRDLIRGTTRRGVPLELDIQLPDATLSPLELAIRGERLASYLDAMARLKPADRQLIVWRMELGFTVEEIAARLGKSTPAAGMRVTRAVARLGALLKVQSADARE